MTTLTAMKARIADELARADLTSQIASAITTAISIYQMERFRFSESRTMTFSTVTGQQLYGAAANANIPTLFDIDYLTIAVGTTVQAIMRREPEELEILCQDGTQEGLPESFSYYDEKIRLYPVPDQVYTVSIAGHYNVAAPASDAETDNRWMTTAERLIRSRAKYELATHVLSDPTLAQQMSPDVPTGAAYEAFRDLKGETNRLTGRGTVRPMAF